MRAEFPNTPKGRERLAGRLTESAPVRCVYEAGPCGYELRRFLEGIDLNRFRSPRELMALIGATTRGDRNRQEG